VSPKARSAGLIGLGVLIAGAGLWLWQQTFSRDAQIDALHRACMAEFAEVAAKMKAGVQPGETSSGIAKGLSESFGKLLEGMSGGVSDAVCAAVRDACRDDFDGRICTAARDRYR
jgi:hypothetical protein